MGTPSIPTPAPTRRGHTAAPAAAALALALLLAACVAGDAADGMITTTDTLADGATLVRPTPPPDGVPVTWRLDEELRIGTMDGGGPAQFGRAGGLAVADDGRIAVLDAQAQDIRVFDADGPHLRTLSRKGGGPGEMEGANGIVIGPDGLLRVLDGRNGRIAFFDLDTGFVRSHPYHPLSLTWMWEGVLDDHGILWATHFIRAEQPGERPKRVRRLRQRRHARRYDPPPPRGLRLRPLPRPARRLDREAGRRDHGPPSASPTTPVSSTSWTPGSASGPPSTATRPTGSSAGPAATPRWSSRPHAPSCPSSPRAPPAPTPSRSF